MYQIINYWLINSSNFSNSTFILSLLALRIEANSSF